MAVLVAAVVVLGMLNWWQTNRELDHLLDAVEESERAITDSEYQWRRRAAADSELANLDSSDLILNRDRVRDRFRAIVSEASADATATLQTVGVGIEDVEILPWHWSLLAARDAYLHHHQAWVNYHRATAADPMMVGDNLLMADIRSTFELAQRRINEAMPTAPQHDAEDRVAAIFAE